MSFGFRWLARFKDEEKQHQTLKMERWFLQRHENITKSFGHLDRGQLMKNHHEEQS